MDDSWRRVQIGSKLPRRRSTEETSSFTRKNFFGFNFPETETLDPDEFNDVFGGPPRSVLLRQFSCDFSAERLASFYDEIFRVTETEIPVRNGRNLPGFRIPSTRGGFQGNDGFYNDIFGFDDDRRSRSRSKSKSKSNSSSVLSSEDLSPLRPSIAEDVVFSSFASKLRPINVPSRQNSSPPLPVEHQKKKVTPAAPCIRPSHMEFHLTEDISKENFGYSHRFASPETISIEPNSYRSIKVSVDDPDINSPSSIISSMIHDPDSRAGISVKSYREEDKGEVYEEEDEEEEEEDLNSYVIEIASDRREETDEAVAVDEAIAWAKEKFQARNFKESECRIQQDNLKEMFKERENRRDSFIEIAEDVVPDYVAQLRRGYGAPHSLMEKASQQLERWVANEDSRHPGKDMAMEVLDEEIKRWSAGKEGNIRSLLSTLQYILWPKSGWHAVPLTDMIEPSHLRKAYQKARLCIHPDKMQQKGATIPQKYVAEKVFAILQDAWSIFNSQNEFSR